MTVSVFGSGSCKPGSKIYKQAESVGKSLAESGHTIVTGGYGGVMEASAKGVSEAGGKAVGITLSQKPEGNQYSKIIVAEDYFDRLRQLMKSNAYVFFPGENGTISELTIAMHLQSAYEKLGIANNTKIVIIGSYIRWHLAYNNVCQNLKIEREKMEIVTATDGDIANKVISCL